MFIPERCPALWFLTYSLQRGDKVKQGQGVDDGTVGAVTTTGIQATYGCYSRRQKKQGVRMTVLPVLLLSLKSATCGCYGRR